MQSRSLFQTIALVLCVLALFVTQTFGGQRVYMCLCTGHAVVTQQTHCHGPHGPQCHGAGRETPESHGENDQGSREEHLEVHCDIALRTTEVARQLIAPSVLLEVRPLIEMLLRPLEAKGPVATFVREEGPAPFGVAVARTVVLLI